VGVVLIECELEALPQGAKQVLEVYGTPHVTGSLLADPFVGSLANSCLSLC
jgi:hypothetical protein